MKILHISNHILNAGNGIVNVAVDLACVQAIAGHTVAFASAGGQYEELLANFSVHHFSMNQERSVPNIVRAAFVYKDILQEFKPDIVHSHMMTGMVFSKLFKGFYCCK
jgi:Glycosyltransferase Family 4